jgi:hypothetical protein
MLNALATFGMYGAAEQALMQAIERAVVALGVGSAIGLAIAGLMLGAEALFRSQREKSADRGTEQRRPKGARKQRKEVYR